jgi:predicted HTH transcriptional regulator
LPYNVCKGNLSADRDSVEGTSLKDIALPTLKTFLYKRYTAKCKAAGIFGPTIQTSEIEEIVNAIDVNFTIEKLLQNISLMDAQGQLTLSGLLLLGKSIQRYKPVFTLKCVSFVGNSVATTEFRDKMPDMEMEGNLLHQYNTAISFFNRNLKSIQVEREFNSLPHLEIPLEVFIETLTNALIHRDYYQNAPIRLFIFDNRVEIISPGILPDSVTEESIKQGISKPRNHLLFENAKFLLPYTGIGSGIVRALKSYDQITFQNDYVREEFIITAVRPELPDEEDSDEEKSNYDTNYDEEKSNYDSNYDEDKNNYDSNYDEGKSVYDGVQDEGKSVQDGVQDDGVSVYDNGKSVYDGVYDEEKSVYDGVYDEKILAFSLLPKNRKEIMNLLNISTQTHNYERHIAPLLEKELLAMTLPDKPKSKNQKYITTEKGKRILKAKPLNAIS